ncbi:alpha/beta hydrolase family protein [Paenibacillus rubinfantis]|uniref:alpha/beta hydrolase family protein n=1 Tax=Paenibacillus rubinfantis TaxID=1720296 RepID=UPI00073EFE08|nr:alpha/beta fold hydrolase [Paenibacillus rubinfantis]
MTKRSLFKNAAAATLALTLALPSASAFAAKQSATSLAPVREAAESFGAQVHWLSGSQTILVTKDSHKLVLTLGSAEALFDGKPVALSEPVRIAEGRALIDAEFLTEAFEVKDPAQSKANDGTQDPADLFLKALLAGDGAEAAKYVSASSSYALPAAMLNQLWTNYETVFGKAAGTPSKSQSANSVHRNVTYAFQTSAIPMNLTLRLNAAGEIDDMYIAAATSSGAYQKPAYEDSAAYTEREVTVGEGAMALPGTLTLPAAGEGPFPAVVLVHGSGTNDRDEAIGGGKPFRDLAVGLAAQGIAVLRYDKVTYEHTFKVAADPKFTLKKETVDDALKAVALLKKTPEVDVSRIFVAGHSQGGYAMPLITAGDSNGDIAGTILLSGPSGKFADVLAEQQAELVSRVKQLGQDTTPYEQQAAVYTSIAAMVNDPQYTVDHMPEQFPIQPAYWWFEQKNYVPAELAKQQSGPMLILQGENDWQVTMKQFAGWKTALQNRKDVTFKSYPQVNHLLAKADGLSIGAEYAQPSNVSKEIIDDISAWVRGIQ